MHGKMHDVHEESGDETEEIPADNSRSPDDYLTPHDYWSPGNGEPVDNSLAPDDSRPLHNDHESANDSDNNEFVSDSNGLAENGNGPPDNSWPLGHGTEARPDAVLTIQRSARDYANGYLDGFTDGVVVGPRLPSEVVGFAHDRFRNGHPKGDDRRELMRITMAEFMRETVASANTNNLLT